MKPMKPTISSEERDQQVALFDALYESHRRALYGFHLGRAGNAETAADLLQETFLRAWCQIGTLQAMAPEQRGFWLFRVARNLSIDQHRRAPRGEELLEENWSDPARSGGDPTRIAENCELAARVHAALLQLTDELREVLCLQVMGGLNSREIGQLLDKPPGTVRYQISQARRRLELQLGFASNCPPSKFPASEAQLP